MAVFDATKERLELAQIDGIPVLFTNMRLDRDTVPKDLFCYDVRDSDRLDGSMTEIKNFVLVNHWGTVLSKNPFSLNEYGSYYPKDWSYWNVCMDLEEFQQSTEEQLQMKVDGEAGMQMGAM